MTDPSPTITEKMYVRRTMIHERELTMTETLMVFVLKFTMHTGQNVESQKK